jgi:2,3-bisphosphoglycerate-independent phosphoglycerate mutase
VQRNYDAGVTDEFIEPLILEGRPRLDPATDTAIFFNFRPDRGRQLAEKLGELGVDLTTMTRYRDDFPFPVAFPEHVVEGTLAEVLSERGVRQLHAAETEKYAHVTYFLDGGREQPFANEERILIDSPRDVASYDLKPQMSAVEVADKVVAAIDDGGLGFVVVNFANPDMVGHTGVIPAVVQAVETTDTCLGRVVDAVARAGGVCLIIADHGNAEKLLQDDGVSPHTAHTTNPVPAILTAPGFALRDGELSEVAPTILALLGAPKSSQMTQKGLLE